MQVSDELVQAESVEKFLDVVHDDAGTSVVFTTTVFKVIRSNSSEPVGASYQTSSHLRVFGGNLTSFDVVYSRSQHGQSFRFILVFESVRLG